MIKERFSLFVILSLLAHLALFGLVVVFGPEVDKVPSAEAARAADFKVFQEALREYASDGPAPKRLANAMIEISEEELAEAFRQVPVLDDRLTGQEKAGLYKMMMVDAMANFTEGVGERSALDEPLSRYFGSLREVPRAGPDEGFELVRVGDALDESARLFRISKETARELRSLSAKTSGSLGHESEVLIRDDTGRVASIPSEYFYRDSPYMEIAAVGAKLFYVIKGFPEIPASATDGTEERPARPLEPHLSPALQVIYMPRARPREPVPANPAVRSTLSLRPGEAGRILDGLMALPGEEQVRAFDRDFLRKYDPDSKDLADLTTEFIYRNLGMVFVLMNDPLSRGFDMLEEIFYDNLSQDELVPYALRNPRTRTGAAILLCLAASYEFERRALLALDGSIAAAKSILSDTSEESYFVHNKDVKAYVLRQVYRDLAAELHRRDYGSLESVLQRYRDEQIKIYDALILMGGEARSRALYALGRLHWDEGQTDLALSTWQGIDPGQAGGTSREVRQALTGVGPVTYRIESILARESGLDRSRLFDRIKRFRKWDKR